MAFHLLFIRYMKSSFTSNKNILVVDPDKDFCKNIRLFLEENYAVSCCHELEYLDYTILLKRINLLIIDADFGSQKLADVLSQIHQKHPALKSVVMYTYFSSDKNEERVVSEEADDMIAKPFDVKKLKEKLDLLLVSQSTVT